MSSRSHEAQLAPALPQKFSRYRSVRKNGHNDAMAPDPSNSATSLPMPSDTASAKTQESIKRSMSRYRNRPGSSKVTSVPPPPPPPVPALNSRPHTHGTDHNAFGNNINNNNNRNYESSIDRALPEEQWHDAQSGQTQHLPFHDASRDPAPQSQPSNPRLHNEFHSARNSRHREHHHHHGSNNGADEQHATGPKRLSFLEKLREEASGRFHSKSGPPSPVSRGGQGYMQHSTEEELHANARAAAKHGSHPHRTKKHIKEKKSGGLFSRFKSFEAGLGSRAKDDGRENWKDMISAPQPVDPSVVPKAAPADDTPVSAVNAGEREVQVICNGALISLPVTPTTTAYDILASVADNNGERGIKPRDSTLAESFKQLGLERPLRTYENVRDVMNSWDNGSRNHLLAGPRSDDHGEEDEELLEVQYAPAKQPSETSFQLYHSQRAGKWEKRWITLKPDGQVQLAKKEGVEGTNICHMSDFDIYQLSRREFKRVKPPKKFCYAVKSQQKSSMFLSQEKYVHYFSSNEREVALRWYRAMQQWRSWYLLNMLGAGRDNNNNNNNRTEDSGLQQYGNGLPMNYSSTARHNMTTVPDQHRSSAESTNSHKRYPEPEVRGREKEIRPGHGTQESHASSSASKAYRRDPSVRHPSNHPSRSRPSSPKPANNRPFSGDRSSVRSGSRYHHHQQQQHQHHNNKAGAPNPQDSNEEPFAPTSLLGSTYTQRQNAMREREKEQERDGPFTKNGLLGNLEPGQPPASASAFPKSSDPPSRHGSVRQPRQPQKPLVDLTPTYMEPPQHRRKGRGVTAEPGTLLVDHVTGPDLAPGAIVVPSATTWRKSDPRNGTATEAAEQTMLAGGGGGGGGGGGRQRAGTQRSQRRPQQPALQMQRHTSVDITNKSRSGSPTEASPFSPTGLVARSARANTTQGAAATGRGVATGDRNAVGKPLLDMSEPSQFAAGSLLRAVEQQGGGNSSGDR